MNSLNKEEMISTLKEMVHVPSISGTEHEKAMIEKIKNILRGIVYFKKNPQNIFINKLKNDELGRSYIAALLKGNSKQNQTIVLMGHYDVVDISDYGEYSDLAFSPDKLTDLYKDILTDNANGEGEYLFGRGTADMKGGLTVQLAIMKYFSQCENKLPGNLLFIAVPDEENNSQGMVNAIPFLKKLEQRYNLKYRAVINCEPNFPRYPGDDNKYIYSGSIGKALINFYCVGEESHAGSPLSGLNANLITSEIVRLLEGRMNLSQKVGQVITPPPTCLKQGDFKELYSAKLPHKSYVYFSYSTAGLTAYDIIQKMKDIAKKAADNIKKTQSKAINKYNKFQGIRLTKAERPEVITYKDLWKRVKKKKGELLESKLKDFYKQNNGLSLQQMGIKLVEYLDSLDSNNNPRIIISFLPPYYPALTQDKKSYPHIYKVRKDIIKEARNKFSVDLKGCDIFPGISDLSYFQLKDYEQAAAYLKSNLPNWGLGYSLPLKEMAELNIPILNLGVYGKDIHKYTERIELKYSFEVLPQLLIKAILDLLE